MTPIDDPAIVEVPGGSTVDGRRIAARCDEPKGDPGNILSRAEITAKAEALIRFGGAHDAQGVSATVDRLWHIASWPRVKSLLS